jgi:hypothetical protein
MKHELCFETQFVFAKLLLPVILFVLLLNPLPGFGQSGTALQVQAMNPRVSATSLYILTFTLSDTVYPNGSFELAFPAGFDLSKVAIAGSDAINGGLRVAVDAQKLNISRTGEGSVKNPGEKLDLKFSTVTNPAESTAHEITMTVKMSETRSATTDFRGTVTITER